MAREPASTSRPNVYGVSRGVWDDPEFDGDEFSRREAWLWLIGAAAWRELRVKGNAGPITLARGEFSFSVRFLAEKFQWTKSRVERFILALENRDTLRDTSRDGAKIYSIKNYNRFQVVGVAKRDSDRDSERDETETAPRQHRDKEETGKTGIAGNNKTPAALRAEFEDEFWPTCPRKVGKDDAFKAFTKARHKTDLETLTKAMLRYGISRVGLPRRYTVHPSKWLNAGRWNDEDFDDAPEHSRENRRSAHASFLAGGAAFLARLDASEDGVPGESQGDQH